MSALKIGNVLRAGLMAWAMFMDLNVRSGDNYVNIGQSLDGDERRGSAGGVGVSFWR